MPKKIALFIDGTWNEPSDQVPAAETNVRKLFNATEESTDQKTKYLAGIGTDHPEVVGWLDKPAAAVHRMVAGLTGYGTSHRIKKAYQFLSSQYERGDKVFLF